MTTSRVQSFLSSQRRIRVALAVAAFMSWLAACGSVGARVPTDSAWTHTNPPPSLTGQPTHCAPFAAELVTPSESVALLTCAGVAVASPASVSMRVGEQAQLSGPQARGLHLLSSVPALATVEGDVVRAVAPGVVAIVHDSTAPGTVQCASAAATCPVVLLRVLP